MKFQIELTLPGGGKVLGEAEALKPGDVSKAIHGVLEIARKDHGAAATVFDCELKLTTLSESARQLARLGGSEPRLKLTPRRR